MWVLIYKDVLFEGAWAIRKSTIKDVVRGGNRVTNDFTDKTYSKVSEGRKNNCLTFHGDDSFETRPSEMKVSP